MATTPRLIVSSTEEGNCRVEFRRAFARTLKKDPFALGDFMEEGKDREKGWLRQELFQTGAKTIHENESTVIMCIRASIAASGRNSVHRILSESWGKSVNGFDNFFKAVKLEITGTCDDQGTIASDLFEAVKKTLSTRKKKVDFVSTFLEERKSADSTRGWLRRAVFGTESTDAFPSQEEATIAVLVYLCAGASTSHVEAFDFAWGPCELCFDHLLSSPSSLDQFFCLVAEKRSIVHEQTAPDQFFCLVAEKRSIVHEQTAPKCNTACTGIPKPNQGHVAPRLAPRPSSNVKFTGEVLMLEKYLHGGELGQDGDDDTVAVKRSDLRHLLKQFQEMKAALEQHPETKAHRTLAALADRNNFSKLDNVSSTQGRSMNPVTYFRLTKPSENVPGVDTKEGKEMVTRRSREIELIMGHLHGDIAHAVVKTLARKHGLVAIDKAQIAPLAIHCSTSTEHECEDEL